MKAIVIINGPNLNLTGIREPDIYGTTTVEEYLSALRQKYANLRIDYYQSNIEGELINCIQRALTDYDGIIINAGGYSHTSVAIHDALLAVDKPAIEVHLSNIFSRESYRHHSLVTPACRGMIAGLGLYGYALAIEAMRDILSR